MTPETSGRAMALLGLCLSLPALGADDIQFNRDIRPILSDKCFTCHGPDKNTRKADLRLDLREDAFRDLGGYVAIAPGDPEQSELIRRIETTDEDDVMPPADSNLKLTPSEKDWLRRWIADGAEYQAHWSFLPPAKPDPAETNLHPIDSFIRTQLARKGLSPSPRENKERLLRRVTMDLTGLPPDVAAIDQFLADESPTAYEKAVDRLLATPAHAERLALDWMDVSRYADSHGMHADGYRMMWPWRDWVIEAFHKNLRFDEFVTWQLAGDLLPDATREQILATAFHRNHPMTAEGGVIDEEFRLTYVIDCTQTTATAFLGMTMECSRCHDHKFDPISQEEFYRVAAFFNNVKELGMTGDDDNYGPMLPLPSREQEEQLQQIDAAIASVERKLAERRAQVDPNVKQEPASKDLPAPAVHLPLDEFVEVEADEKKVRRVDGHADTGIAGEPEVIAGRIGKAVEFDSEYDVLTLEKHGLFEAVDAYSAGAWIRSGTTENKTQSIMGTAGDKNNFWRGWDFFLDEDRHLGLRLIHALPDDYLDVRSVATIPDDAWTHVLFTYDGSGAAGGVRLFINGKSAGTQTVFDRLSRSILPVNNDATRTKAQRAIRIGKSYRGFTGDNGIFRGAIDDVRIFRTELTVPEVTRLYAIVSDEEASVESLSDKDWRDHLLKRSDQDYRNLTHWLKELRMSRMELLDGIPEVMVMAEMDRPREMHVLKRGQYDQPQQAVEPGTPEAILPFPDSLPRNRLGLAKWLFFPENPLTARVTVNRYWQMFFGRGLVETSEDFGNQGSRPTHPELLDWLAVDFMESGWDLRHLIRQIVLSETYQQSSRITADHLAKDPANRWLARAPSYRLPGELIRDHALAASGLMNDEIGGPSVKPYQPEGLWFEKGNFSAKLLRYQHDSGDKLYRRSLYTFVRRTSPHPAMIAFDAPPRDVCTVRRERTSTPLQALVLMNDPEFFEAARIMAERVQREGGDTVHEQIEFGFRALTGRHPTPLELEILNDQFQAEWDRFRSDPDEADAIFSVGERERDPLLEPARTAALAVVMNTLMNHDEFYMKR